MATAFKDYYVVLGVPKTATSKDIKAAFRKLARKHHPDVNLGDATAESRFKEINEANEVLSDPEKRKKYDRYGADWKQYEAWEKAGRPGAGPDGEPPFGPGGRGGGSPFGRGGSPFGGGGTQVEYQSMSAEDLEEMFGGGAPFSDFFHDMFGSHPEGGTPSRRARPARSGEDVEGETQITLAEAMSGTTRTVEIDGRKVEVKIPSGIRDGARVRAAGQGARGSSGGRPGDLYLRVRIRPDPHFTREGDNLRVKVPIPVETALLGGTVEVPTLKGTRVHLTIPPETQNGKVLRLRGQGMAHLKGGGAGDLLAEVDVRLPIPMDAATREWAQKRRERTGA